jgi:hypothetical protein
MSGIVANDSAALSPGNTSYEILIFDPANNSILVPPFAVQINHANGATQDLSVLWLNQAATPQPLVHYMQSANNLSDISSLPAAQTNLGLNSLATGPASAIQTSFNPQFMSAGTSYSAVANDLACANCTTGNSIVNLPNAPANGTTVGVKLILQNTPSGSTGLYSLTVNTQGTDKFETTTGGTSANIGVLGEAATWRYYSATKVWVRQWGNISMSQIQKFMPKVLNILSYGADPTAVADSTAAITAAINTATGSAAPSSNSRAATVAVYAPTGSYKITSDLLIQSTLGFNFFGDGPESTIFVCSGTGFTTGPIVVDGSYAGRYGGFTIKGDTTEQVTNAFTLTWTTGAARSTTGNKIFDIRVRNLNFVTGMNLAGVTNRQVDSTHLSCIVIGGSQTTGAWSNSGNWQQGFVFGNGTFANIYDQVLTRCEASNVYYGFYNNVSSFSLNGAQPANNFCDFYMNPGAQSTITNVQSQNSSQFVTSPSNFSPQPNTFNDCQFKTSFLSTASNNAFVTLAGGQWNFNNLSAGATQVTNTVASGSNGGAINTIASWSSPSAGVLAVSSTAGFPASGTVNVATSTTNAVISYTGTSGGNQLTGCAYVSGGTGTVSTGGNVFQYEQATISVVGASTVRPCTALFSNLTTFGTKTSAFSTITNSIISVTGYNNYNPLTGNYTYATGDVASLNTGGIWTTVGGPGVPPQINYITATGTTSYTIPAGAQTLDVTVVGAGAGGSSGAFATSTGAGGGAGGGGGGVSRSQFQVSALTSPVSVTVGVGGTGGAAVTSNAAGNSGGVGGSTTFGGYLWGQGGRNGSGGAVTNTAVAAGGAGGTGTNVSGAGGSSILTPAAPTGATAQSSGGGGAGGGFSATTVAAGSNGGTITNIASWGTPGAGILAVTAGANMPTSGTAIVGTSNTPAVITYTGVSSNTLTGCAYVSGGTGTVTTTTSVVASTTPQAGAGCTAPSLGTSSNSSTGGVVGGASPTNGSAPAAQGDTAPGAGGGAASVTSAQNGAAAQANSGGGGGGGGACQAGTTSGAGGNGGSGFALIIAYFQ